MMSFKVPKVPNVLKKNHSIQKVYDELPITLSKDVNIVKEIGRGSFGRVMLCIKKGETQVILKEMQKCSDYQAKLFVKEAKIINKFTHTNIVQFDSLYQSDDPDTLAFLMEYVYFDFLHFGEELKISSLGELLLRLDKFDCKDFEHFQMVLAKDITKGLSFLHENDVVHRDLKPDNILISNQHYKNSVEMKKYWMLKPVVAKITDFGESRASVIQTLTLNEAVTSNICRGTSAYMAQEAFTDHSVKFGLNELKNIDIWALLMTFYVLINPNKKYPFEDEIEKWYNLGVTDFIQIMKQIFRNISAPQHSKKYQELRLTQWKTISNIFDTCTSTRRPSSKEILLILEKESNIERQKQPTPEQIDRILASIYGQCIGDAIGLLTEFLSKTEAKLYYGKVAKELEYLHKQIVCDGHRSRWKEGDWTDDSDQMILIMRSLVDCDGQVDPVDFAKKLKTWIRSGFSELGDFGGLGLSATTSKVTSHPDYLKDPHEVARSIWEEKDRNSALNGAVMRTSIVGIHMYWSLDDVTKNARDFAKTTHHDPRCQASTVAVSIAIATMLQGNHKDRRGKFRVKDIIQDAYEYASTCLETETEKKDLMFYLKCDDIKDLKLDEDDKIGYTYKSMGTGFWALKQDIFRKTITKIIMQGGDSDANACVGGALLGCKLGLSALPESWLTKLLHKDWLENEIKKYFEMMKWERNEK